MLSKEINENYTLILKEELVEALGCTEPIAIAYAAAKAKSVLDKEVERVEINCSGNIIKNVKGVVVPNTGGMIGIEAAAVAGIVGGDSDKKLQVLETVTKDDLIRIKKLIANNFCTVNHLEGVENLYIVAKVYSGNEFAEVTIADEHTNIIKIIKNGEVISKKDNSVKEKEHPIKNTHLLNIRDILEFANTVDLDAYGLRSLIKNQIDRNEAIAEEGLKSDYGVSVGKTLIETYGDDIKTRAKAKAAAGSDARMSGCSLPVVINSGSGNQGITVSVPVIEYARELKVSEEKLIRALLISNLVSIHQKSLIGALSAYCGAVSAATGSAAAITYLHGGDYDAISRTIINTIANISGIVCDGAKPSCAAKIASSVDAAILGHKLSMKNMVFKDGEGLVKDGVEGTVESIGRLGNKGMEGTDVEIINIMIGK